MIDFTAAEIAQITGGELAANPHLSPSSVVTDSREATAGSLYVAKAGEHADGHDFIAAAVESGAVLTLGERQILDADGLPFPSVIVPDAILAMGALAAAAVERIREARRAQGGELTVVGITGSAGKTTTKDLLAGILATQGPTVAPQGSYNGEVGVPLTVFQATEDTRYLVIEMGATGIGHITYLTDMVRPSIGVVLCVGTAHAGEFGGVENIAIAKGELAEAIPAGGRVILNTDDARVAAMRERATAPVWGFSADGDTAAAIRAEDVSLDDAGQPVFTLVFPDGSAHPIASRLIGLHHVNNLLAAAAAAFAAGVAPEAIAASLNEQKAASRWRMERTERTDGVTVINDAYNANPESMRAALKTLAQLGRERRTWAVLGAMLELGDESIREHTAVGTQVVRLNIDQLLVVGRQARALYISAINEGSWGSEALFAEDLEEAERILDEGLKPGDLVLFKSSNGVGLRHLGDRIALRGRTPSGASASPSAHEDTHGDEGSGRL
ncbi:MULTISPECIES: UDP-N-acetylmuramoyl-tripeptide--D-alanyl-D-alanine ligase [Arthrobacter]|uniref:UDP-N-acetylmuramoyl-tripeptide--D-alanyl-D-alanine ligase n=2 Tax=Arthrobacter TaxID=1663 RepID=A0ABU9KH46_9MICC|nr:UDP-N-acetylmuramoyl-tripeptide--D-alanyl-D-alanine ligase [Arthrobacter sp. YJM1]MDP5226206.1 UDP-N-acetylmuramoyl-tripeptide--D-alanyl-D-alanine ligase [Arthrobacter sp. YJM1]